MHNWDNQSKLYFLLIHFNITQTFYAVEDNFKDGATVQQFKIKIICQNTTETIFREKIPGSFGTVTQFNNLTRNCFFGWQVYYISIKFS